jgi:uncharacterized SAM-binding protein YcdF (DUF218 family)
MILEPASLLLPSGVVTLLCLAGIAALLVRRTRRIAYLPLAVAAAAMLLFSNGGIATLLTSPLEYAYPAMQDPQQHPEARAIVVLTAYVTDDKDMPLSTKMNSSSAFRVLEAANLFARRPECQVIVTGGAVAARIMGRQLQVLGVPASRLMIEDQSIHTISSARNLQPLLAGKAVFLVTSAGHMRRAMGVFQKQGILPIAAPTDYKLPRSAAHASWTSSSFHLQASDLAVHEYLALLWYRVSGKL